MTDPRADDPRDTPEASATGGEASTPDILRGADGAQRPVHDAELSERLQARTEELFGTGAINIVPGMPPQEVRWAPREAVRRGLGGSAFAFSLAALGGSFVVAWMFPLGIFSLVLGAIAVRRPEESSRLGAWAIGFSILSLMYSAGWIWWIGTRFEWWSWPL